jgi:S1-C subfamily serine protease
MPQKARPARSAGLASGDVITSLNGTTISSANGLTNETASSQTPVRARFARFVAAPPRPGP